MVAPRKLIYDTYSPIAEWAWGGSTNEGEPFVVTPITNSDGTLSVIYQLMSQNTSQDFDDGLGPMERKDNGICVMAASAAMAAGITVEPTPTTPNVPDVPTAGFTDVAADASGR